MFLIGAAVLTIAAAVVGVVKALSDKPRHSPGEKERREAERLEREYAAEEKRINKEMERQRSQHEQRINEERERQRSQHEQRINAALEEQTREESKQRQEIEKLDAQAKKIAQAREENRQRADEQQRHIAQEWPKPQWYVTTPNSVNFGVTGASGVGKSSLINAMLGLKPTDLGAAKVGVTETTVQPKAYAAPVGRLGDLKLWDLPGAGTQLFPRDVYIKQMGLRYFDGLLIVNSTRFTEVDRMLFREARAWQIPCYLVRTKADVDIESAADDYGKDPNVTLQEILTDLTNRLIQDDIQSGRATESDRIFVTTSRKNKFQGVLGPQFRQLLQKMAEDVRVQRQPNVP